jgi:hypothetical protein
MRTPLVDARDWVGEKDMLDSHHLLPRGAASFTRRLGREVIRPHLARAEAARGQLAARTP